MVEHGLQLSFVNGTQGFLSQGFPAVFGKGQQIGEELDDVDMDG